MKLRIGEIPYANLFPIFYTLKKEFSCPEFEFIQGAPSEVNKMLREGLIDLSPSSSIEYLKNPLLYKIIEGHSISSHGPVGSILLFSEKPIEELADSRINVSSQSETSIALLDVVLRRFYNISSELVITDNPRDSGGDAFLLIGDDALKCGCEVRDEEAKWRGTKVYDLGDIWQRNTGLPFVFALWIVRTEVFAEKPELLGKFIKALDMAKASALNNLAEIARCARTSSFMTEEQVLSYWNCLDYELTDEHKAGLKLFGQYYSSIQAL